ncbi:MAG: nitroreductase family protein [Methanomassiliicoccales archaeon]|nr:nitroreductase family protein [Methanomassiliicoccales archaeon]
MGVMDVIRGRRSIRKYKKKPIPEDLLTEILEAARLAPSGANRQFWKLIVVRDEERKKGLVPLCRDQKFIEDCSAFIAAVDDPSQKWYRVDVAIALDHLSLAAAEKGLGTCWIGAFDPEKVAEYLGVPKGLVVTVCMTLGYPAESPEPRPRKPLEELVFWEKYGEKV